MIDTGILRRIDDMGRIVLPKELRNSLNLKERDGMQIFLDDNSIILKPYRTMCFVCGESEMDQIATINGCTICRACAGKVVATLEATTIVSHERR